jgi:hypothetical protein
MVTVSMCMAMSVTAVMMGIFVIDGYIIMSIVVMVIFVMMMMVTVF